MAMDARKRRILGAIVALYGQGGEPVGSGLLAHRFDMGVSSATLRNEMAALTRLGLLEQPHTSAGRIPSTEGYRYYLQELLAQSELLPNDEFTHIKRTFANLDKEPVKFAQGSAKALSKMTGYTAAVTTARAEDLCIVHFEVVQVGRNSAAVLAVTSSGGVHTRVARIKDGISRENATTLAAVLNQAMTFVVPDDLTDVLVQSICVKVGYRLQSVVTAAAELLKDSAEPHVFLAGEQYLLRWPELQGYLPKLLSTLNDEEAAGNLITPKNTDLAVFLGEDFMPRMPGLSIISKRYLAGGGLTGTVALIGPARMDYPKLIPILETFAVGLGGTVFEL